MRPALSLFAAAAATLLAPAPAAAQFADPSAAPGFAARSPDGRHGPRGHHRRFQRGFAGSAFVGYDRDYQGDTAWRSDGFNDWWHDRPDRAYPRWMQGNDTCERRWWGGGGWRC